MSKYKYVKLSLLFVLFSIQFNFAQPFLKPATNSEISFRQLQRDFNAWKDTTDISKKKYWKYFKRWEAEMQLHTDAQGEPIAANEYMEVLIQNAANKNTTLQKSQGTGLWYPVGPFNVPNNLTGYMENGLGRVNCIAFHPSDANTYYVGVAQGGLWKTTNNGTTYTPLTDNLPITRISDIAIDPINPDVIYISVCDFEYLGVGLFLNGRKRNTHYGLGVYKSTDGGATWSPTGLSFQLTNGDASLIRKIIIDPANPANLVACGVSGMYKSTNSGNNWTQVVDSLFWDLIQDPINPSILYAASGWVMTANTGSAAVYKSTDFGTTWTVLNTGIPLQGTVQRVKLAQSRSNPSRIYALAVDTQSGLYAIYRSDNAGNTWTLQFNSTNLLEFNDGTGTGGQGNYDLGFLVHPTNPDKVYVGGVNIWASDDGATTFNPAGYWTNYYGPSIHADIHDLQWQPLTGNYFVCCDGGLYRTNDIIPITWTDAQNGTPWPTIWNNVSDGMNVTSFYRISSSKSTTGELLAGAQDNASFYFDGSAWNTVYGGDGMDNCMDTALPGAYILSSQYGNFVSSTDGGLTHMSLMVNQSGENAEWTTPIVADYNNYLTYYIGFQNVEMSNDGGLTWSQISSFPPPPNFYGNELSALAVSNSDPNVIYAARRVRYEYFNPGSLFKTSNGGISWTDVTAGIPDSLYYTSVEINHTDANTVYITMAGFSAGNKIFKTVNGGISWTNISYNLPNIPVNCIKQIPGTNNLMAATDIGIYVLSDGSTIWLNQSTGLPNVIVSDIEFNPALNKVYLSTFGRGLWASDLDIFTGLEESISGPKIKFHLSPSINHGNFTIVQSENKEAAVEIYDVNGRVVHTTHLHGKTTPLDLSLSSGLYFARIRSGNSMEVKKFVVE